MSNNSKLSEALLCNFEDEIDVSNESKLVKDLWNGNWDEFINQDIFKNLLINFNKIENLKIIIDENDKEELFCIGIASLLCFVQCNFTGPALTSNIIDTLNLYKNCDNEIRKHLIVENEEIDVNCKHPELLVVTKNIFENCSIENNIFTWWYMRYLSTYQQLLDDCAPSLLLKIENKLTEFTDWEINDRLKAKLYLEMAQLYLLFNKVNDCERSIDKAKDLLKMNVELSGELGKRTRYQQQEIAQIVLKVFLAENINRPPVKSTVIPEKLKLDDEVRLDTIQYSNSYKIPDLPVTEQTLVLATVQHMQRAKPLDDLLIEESEAFIATLLQQNNTWGLRFIILFLRCFYESNHKRTIERSLNQCELLINNLNNAEPSVVDRLGCVWSGSMQPRWKTVGHMANLMLNLGLVKGSLDIFLSLQMWEEVIICYTIMQLRNKAAEIIKEQIDKNPTVKLWCLLGDATDDISCYETAWKLSEEKSSRAQKHWGQNLFSRKEYAECIPYLEKSLEINSLQSMVWLRLGYAALEVENWKLAANAYRRYTYLEPGGFEAWNNLAKAYIKMGEKTRAHFALQEALKFSFDNWKIWDNFMLVSAAIDHFSDVIRSYHQILDLKEKHLDLEVLFLLTKHILTNEPSEENSGQHLRLVTKVRELFGRLTSIYPNESKLWEMYSDLSPTNELKAQRLYRAYRGLVQDDWSKDRNKCKIVLEMSKRLGEATIDAGKGSNVSTTRLTLKSVITAAKKQKYEEFDEIMKDLEGILEKVINL